MQNKELSHPKKKMDIKVDYTQLPAGPGFWTISRIPCPSHLRDNYSEQPWRRTGPLKTVAFYTYAYIYTYSFLGLVQQLTNLTAAPSRLIKGDLMAPHSSTLAWRIPWTEEPDGLQSTGSQRVGRD